MRTCYESGNRPIDPSRIVRHSHSRQSLSHNDIILLRPKSYGCVSEESLSNIFQRLGQLDQGQGQSQQH